MIKILFFIIILISYFLIKHIKGEKKFTYKVSKSFNVNVKFGQITSVTIGLNGNIVIFHRGNNIWNE